MKYENRIPDESVNYTTEPPLKEFAWLVGGVLGSLIIVVLVLGFFAGELAARLPYRYEKDLADRLGSSLGSQIHDQKFVATEQSLNELAERLAGNMNLPEGMHITVHYDAAPVFNAFTTIGGNVVVYGGLISKMPDENTLAMVLAHEIAHAKLRHPARSLGRGVAIGIVLSMVNTGLGRNIAGEVLTDAGGLALLKYSRDQERAADAEALAAVVALYHHAGGASELFEILENANGRSGEQGLSMLSTHPLSSDRIQAVKNLAGQHGWALEGPRTPLAATLLADNEQ